MKLCEDMKLLEERERRRSLNTRPKALVNLGSETGQLENRSSRTGAGNSSGSVRRLTYAENAGKGNLEIVRKPAEKESGELKIEEMTEKESRESKIEEEIDPGT